MRRAMVLLGLALAGAGGSAATADHKTSVVEVTLRNYRFEGLPDSIHGPKVRFEAVNRGPSNHELEIIGPDGEPVGEIEEMPAGESGSLAVKLAPGEYVAQCLVKEGDKTHADLGMRQAFSVE